MDDDLSQLDDCALIALRARLREQIGQQGDTVNRAELQAAYDRSTIGIDRRARLAWQGAP